MGIKPISGNPGLPATPIPIPVPAVICKRAKKGFQSMIPDFGTTITHMTNRATWQVFNASATN